MLCRLYRDSTQYKEGKHVRDLSKLNRDMRQVGGAEGGCEQGLGGRVLHPFGLARCFEGATSKAPHLSSAGDHWAAD